MHRLFIQARPHKEFHFILFPLVLEIVAVEHEVKHIKHDAILDVISMILMLMCVGVVTGLWVELTNHSLISRFPLGAQISFFPR